METECFIAIVLGAACLLLGLICICQADKRRTLVTPVQVPKALKDAPVQTMPEPPPSVPRPAAAMPASDGRSSLVDCQTAPAVTVKLGQWRNAPLDLVVCLDSSASFCLARQPPRLQQTKDGEKEIEPLVSFMESGTFQRAKGFIGQLATELHLPDIRVGLIRFEDIDEVICPLTEEVTDFIKSVQTMSLSPGETKFAPAMRKALEMLTESNPAVDIPGGDWPKPKIAKAVLVITDGDPNDMMETKEVTSLFKEKDVQLLFVKVSQDPKAPDSLDSLAVPWPRPPSASYTGSADQEAKGVYRAAADEAKALADLIPDILRQLLRGIRPIVRARCALPLMDYSVAGDIEDLSSIYGHEVLMPKHTLPHHGLQVLWDPYLTDPQAYAMEARARLALQEQLKLAQDEAKQLQQDLQATASISKTRDGESGGTGSGVKVEEIVNSVTSMQQRVDALCAVLPALARKSEEIHREKEALRMENEQLRCKSGGAPAADGADQPAAFHLPQPGFSNETAEPIY